MAAPKGTMPPGAGSGRVKGVPNKTTAALKDMILKALDQAGGVKYLTDQATKNPVAFMGLIGKVLPLQIGNAPGEKAFKIEIVKFGDSE